MNKLLIELDLIEMREFIRDMYPNRSIIATGDDKEAVENVMKGMFPILHWTWVEDLLGIETPLCVSEDLIQGTSLYPSLQNSVEQYISAAIDKETVYVDDNMQIDIQLVTNNAVFLNIKVLTNKRDIQGTY